MRFLGRLFETKESRPQWEIDLAHDDWGKKTIFKNNSDEFFNFLFPANVKELSLDEKGELEALYNALKAEIAFILKAELHEKTQSQAQQEAHTTFITTLQKTLPATIANKDARITLWSNLNSLLFNKANSPIIDDIVEHLIFLTHKQLTYNQAFTHRIAQQFT